MIIVNCTSFCIRDTCLHQAAPRRLFGAAKCILVDDYADPRVKMVCKLQTPVPRPNPPQKPEGPPNEVIGMWSSTTIHQKE